MGIRTNCFQFVKHLQSLGDAVKLIVYITMKFECLIHLLVLIYDTSCENMRGNKNKHSGSVSCNACSASIDLIDILALNTPYILPLFFRLLGNCVAVLVLMISTLFGKTTCQLQWICTPCFHYLRITKTGSPSYNISVVTNLKNVTIQI